MINAIKVKQRIREITDNDHHIVDAAQILQNQFATYNAAYYATRKEKDAIITEDPFVRLFVNYSDFQPGIHNYHMRAEEQMANFIEAVRLTGQAYPERILQYAAWMRDSRQGKGERNQALWIIAVVAGVRECVEHPRFAELLACTIEHPGDALYIIQATKQYLGENQFPAALRKGIAKGLDTLRDEQLMAHANASLNPYPDKDMIYPRYSVWERLIFHNHDSQQAAKPEHQDKRMGNRTLRLVDVLGICKRDLSPRLFALYRYLHAPTRHQAELLPLLEEHLPLFGKQKYLQQHPPHQVAEVQEWVKQALEARMSLEQISSATGMMAGQSLLLQKVKYVSGLKASTRKKLEGQGFLNIEAEKIEKLHQREALHLAIRGELWQALLQARVANEHSPDQNVPLINDLTFLRHLRGMYRAGLSIEALLAEVKSRQFANIWPFQVVSAARHISRYKQRGYYYQVEACPEVQPVLETIFKRIALKALPRKTDGTHYNMLGLANVGGWRVAHIDSESPNATYIDAVLAFAAAFSYTSTNHLAGSWDSTFHPAIRMRDESLIDLLDHIEHSGGYSGASTQVFGVLIHLISWLLEHPEMQPPEVVVVLSYRPFQVPDVFTPWHLDALPQHYQSLIKKPEFYQLPPLAAAIALYREILGREVSLVLWNLAGNASSPGSNGIEHLLMLNGFDANSFRHIEQWLQEGSSAVDMQNINSIEKVLTALKRY